MKGRLCHLGRVLTLSCLLSVPSQAEEVDAPPDMLTLLETFRETYGFPGATVAVARSDGSVESVAVGLADIEARLPMTTDTRMPAASIGKSIWGAVLLSLEADGRIKRTDPVSDYLGDLGWFARIPNAGTMTVGHLLTHSAGLPDHVHMDGVAAMLIALGEAERFDPADVVAFVLDAPPLFEAGSAWSYSDTGYLLLGMVIEAATGDDVFAVANERFLIPLGLSATAASDGPDLAGLAVGYTMDGNPFGLAPRTMDNAGRLTWNPAVEWTGGGFASTSADLAKWGHALFTGAAMERDYLGDLLDGVPVHPDAPQLLYGSGVAIYSETPLGPVYGHGGWVPGYVSSLRHYADYGVTIAFQINTDAGLDHDGTNFVPTLEAALARLFAGLSGD